MFRKRKKAAGSASEPIGDRTPRMEGLSGETAQVFDRVQALHMIAQMPLSRGDSPELVLTALRPLEEALDMVHGARKTQGDLPVLMALEGATLLLMGHVHSKAQQPQEARWAYERALSVYKGAGLQNDADRVRQALVTLGRG